MKKTIAMLLCLLMTLSMLPALGETYVGEAEGFGGKIIAEVTVEDGRIVDLALSGYNETPGFGAAALGPLTKAILEAGTVEGVDAFTGATYTSNGVFNAVKAALSAADAPVEADTATAGASSLPALGETYVGEAEGFGGKIIAEVTIEDGRIVDLSLTGNDETPAIGALALAPLAQAIVEAGTVEGVDAFTGATYTSNGVFNAVKAALGAADAPAESDTMEADTVTASASALNHGVAIVATPRLGPGRDDQEVPVYSFNAVAAYVVTDADGRVVDLEVDILEIITPNHDGARDNALAGWPGAIYNEDADGDGAVEGRLIQTTDNFMDSLPAWQTKRALADGYKLNSGTWAQEMDLFQGALRGMTADGIDAWAAKYLSDVNGRPLHGTSQNDDDIARWEALSDEEKAEMDAISGATMSLTDAHGDILAAIRKALSHQVPVDARADVASLGLGVVVTPRLGPGKDSLEIPVYSFNIVAAGAMYDADGRVVGAREDIMEVITPNHDSAHDSKFTGWPGQSYNGDVDGDGAVEAVLEQSDESFVAQVNAFVTKRDLDTLYRLNSGTWAQEVDLFEAFFAGRTVEELRAFFEAQCSDSNGRVIRADTTNEADLAKWNALTDEQKADVDALTGATISLSDSHGDMLGAMEASWNAARPCAITIE